VARLLASLGGYVYSVGEQDVFVHLYLQSTSTLTVNSQQVILRQETAYPWDGAIRLSLQIEQPSTFGVNLRIPGWCRQAQVSVNGENISIEPALHKGYARLERLWQPGDTILLRLEMPIERLYAHPAVQANAGSVALQRGPLVYCLETADNPLPLHRIRLPEAAVLESQFVPDLLGGVAILRGNAAALKTDDWAGMLYRQTPPVQAPHPLVAIPYYAWDHRQPGEMLVWIGTTL
jgi:DUF1680 family protein